MSVTSHPGVPQEFRAVLRNLVGQQLHLQSCCIVLGVPVHSQFLLVHLDTPGSWHCSLETSSMEASKEWGSACPSFCGQEVRRSEQGYRSSSLSLQRTVLSEVTRSEVLCAQPQSAGPPTETAKSPLVLVAHSNVGQCCQ